jgi:hypothetical protein
VNFAVLLGKKQRVRPKAMQIVTRGCLVADINAELWTREQMRSECAGFAVAVPKFCHRCFAGGGSKATFCVALKRINSSQLAADVDCVLLGSRRTVIEFN